MSIVGDENSWLWGTGINDDVNPRCSGSDAVVDHIGDRAWEVVPDVAEGFGESRG
jgi:hypothetical protein